MLRTSAIKRVGVAAMMTEAPALTTWRCINCGRILAKLIVVPGSVVQIKCSSCKVMNEVGHARG